MIYNQKLIYGIAPKKMIKGRVEITTVDESHIIPYPFIKEQIHRKKGLCYRLHK